MAIDDNTSYELTGAQVKDLAARIKASGSGMIVYVDASFESPSSITNVFSDSGLTTVADWEDMADVILAGGTVIAVYDNGSNKHQYVELVSVTVNDNVAVGKRFAGVISNDVGEGSKPLTIFLYYNDGIATPRWFAEGSSLPTVNNGTLTIQHNGTNIQTFTANQSTNATANIETIWADDAIPTTSVPPVTTSLIEDGAVTPAKLSDTGWVLADQYVNTAYFSPRAHIYYRILGGVVYWSGEVYCHTAPGSNQQSILVNLPLNLRAFQQVNIYGSQYMVSNSDYSIWTELDYFVLREINQNIPATSDYQGYNLGQMRYISSEY